MECFEQKPTKRIVLNELEEELNRKLGLKAGKFGAMIHRSSAYGGNALVGYVNPDSSGVVDITLYEMGRISDKKMIDFMESVIKILEYAERQKSKEGFRF
jgi:hypothetical protein